ncbi:MAG: hypothetical protein LIQ30_04425, partial [Planctomycetes bacterium]|nr:hypothetical protein [Planctomycetota bacterium]
MDMDFKKMVEERAELGIPPLPLDAAHTRRVCDLLNSPDVAADTKETLAWILANRVPPGVNPAAKEKCEFLIDKLLGNAPHAPQNGAPGQQRGDPKPRGDCNHPPAGGHGPEG